MSITSNPLLSHLGNRFRKDIGIVILTGLGVAALNGLTVYFLKSTFKSLEKPQFQDILWETGRIFVAFSALVILKYFHGFYSEGLTEKISCELRALIHRRLMEPSNLGLRLAQQAQSGGLLSQTIYDLQLIQANLRYLVDLGRESLVLIFMLGWLFYLNQWLTLILLALLPGLLWIIRRINFWVAKASQESQKQMEEVVQTLKENLDGWRLIQAYNAQDAVHQRLQKLLDEFLQWRLKRLRIFFLGSPVSEWLAMVASLIILIFVSWQIVNQQASYGDFASYMASLLMVTRPVRVVQESSGRLQDAKIAWQRIVNSFQQVEPLPKGYGRAPWPRQWQVLAWENVSVRVPERWILKNIHLKLLKGQKVGIVGPSGGGKSTLINSLLRFFDVSEGAITLDGRPIWEFDLMQWRQNIAYAAQDSYFFSASLWENLMWVNPQLNEAELEPWLKALELWDWVQSLPQGLRTPLGEGAARLSGGQKQRLSLLRALIKPAQIYIFDEPTASLDPELDRRVHHMILERWPEALVIIVGHRVSHLQSCHRIIWIDQGVVKADGPPDQTLAQWLQKNLNPGVTS